MLVSELIIRAAKDFSDYDADGSTNDEKYTEVKIEDWLDYYHAALRQLVLVRPDAHYKTVSVTLVSGTKQTLPSDALRLIDITRNMGTDGSTPGAPVTEIPRSDLDDSLLDWHTADGEIAINHFSYNIKTPKKFFVTPPVHASTVVQVEMDYSYLFTEVAIANVTTTEVELDETFIGPVQDWMMKLAYQIDTESAHNQNISMRCEQSFYQGLGLEFKAGKSIAPQGKK